MANRSIPTPYNGYVFRSRLEARWAIFFDQISAKYAYEPDGFSLEGINYSPDFLLQESIPFTNREKTRSLTNLWVEIKPSNYLEDDERIKLSQFVKVTGNLLLLISGDPDPDSRIKLIERSPEGNLKTIEVIWMENGKGTYELVSVGDFLNKRHIDRNDMKKKLLSSKLLASAYMKAKRFKFEYGRQNNVDDAYTKNCSNCGQQFAPRADYHKLCNPCFYDRSDEKLKVEESDARHRINFVGKKKIIIALTLTILASLIGWFAYSEYTSRNTDAEAVCECSVNSYNCDDFSSQENAQGCFDYCYPSFGDVHVLDSDYDLQVCELLP